MPARTIHVLTMPCMMMSCVHVHVLITGVESLNIALTAQSLMDNVPESIYCVYIYVVLSTITANVLQNRIRPSSSACMETWPIDG